MLDEYIVAGDISLLDIMKKIDKNAQGIVYVCDEYKCLKGVITDGDVRRAIIKSGDIKTKAKEIMNRNPIVLPILEKDRALSVMTQKSIRSIPLVDCDNRIVDICFQEEKNQRVEKHIDSPVVIMAGGKGTRLKPYTNVLPKPLIPIGNKTITEHIMDHFKKAGCTHFDMIINYKKHFIKSYFRDIEYDAEIEFYEESEFLGTAGGLKMLLGKYDKPFFMTNCDILVEADYADVMDFHVKNGNIATIVGAIKNTTLSYGVINTNEEGRVCSIIEKPDISAIVNTGFYVLSPEFLELIPDGEVCQITDLFQTCISKNYRLGMFPISEERWMDMGQKNELQNMIDRLAGV